MPGYISEYSYYGIADTEFIEVAVPTGTDVSSYSVQIYDSEGEFVESYSLGSVQSTTDGQDVYVIDNNTPGFSSMSGQGEIYANDALALIDDNGDVLQFISHEGYEIEGDDGPIEDMTSTNVGYVNAYGDSMQTDDGGVTYYSQPATNKGTIPACYATGTLIETVAGLRAVETLQTGDRVIVSGRDPCQIRWVWQGDQALEEVRCDQKPVLFKSGALGPAVPNRDLIVSPQHRMLVGGSGQLGHVFPDEVLVPAKALTGLRGIRYMQGKRAVRWHHLACDTHEVIRAEGCWSETLLLGPVIVEGLSRCERHEVDRLFPAMPGADWLNGPPARRCLSVGQTRKVLARALQPC